MRLPRLIINFRGQVVPCAPNSPPNNGYVRADAVTVFEDEARSVIKAQHEAIDRLFARLIVTSRGHGELVGGQPFMPSQSPEWPACVAGSDFLKRYPPCVDERPDHLNKGRSK
jgi:hypothetical protein